MSKSTDGLCKKYNNNNKRSITLKQRENALLKTIKKKKILKGLEKFHRNTLIPTSSVLYIPIPQPPEIKSYTSHSFCLLPSAGENTILNLPGWSTTKSVALYWEIKTSNLMRETVLLSVWMHLCKEQTRTDCISYLIAKSVSADCYGLCPPRNEARDVFTQDWLTENCAAQDVPDGSIRTLPHLL